MRLANHETREYTGVVLERLKYLPEGGKMGDLPLELQHKSFIRTGDKKTGGPNLRLLRLERDKPSLTVTAYIFNKFVHPEEDRFITPREAACLQDFPINYEFCGTLSQVQTQIGNAVPVNLAKAIAIEVGRYFKKRDYNRTIKIASYFTGAGGLDLGFEQASNAGMPFITSFSTDIESFSERTIDKNRSHWNFHRYDIRKLSPAYVKEQIIGSPDVIIGGPPCQPFSVAGKQHANKDPLGELYKDYVSHVSFLQPEVVVLENVYGLAQVKTANMIREIYDSFESIGYGIIHKELLAADYGTPQKRRRLFFIAAKDIQCFQFPPPIYCEVPSLFGLPLYKTVGDAFSILPQPVKN